MSIAKILVVSLAAFLVLPAAAGPATDALGACLADNTSGKERKELARWIFIAMTAHPEIQDVARVSPAVRDETNKQIGTIVTRLLTRDCVDQARSAIDSDGANSFEAAFGSLGQLAMRELMSNPQVAGSLDAWEKYFDHQKFEAAMSAK